MGNCLRRLVVLPSVAAQCQKFWVVAACILASLALSEPALAQCTGTPDNTSCAPGPNPATQYPSGINVSTASTPINVTLQPGVQVVITDINVVNAVGLHTAGSPSTGGPATLIANDAAITINTAGIITQETSAMRIQAGGDAIIGTPTNPASGIINVTGTVSTNAVWANVISSAPGAVAS